MQKTSNYDMKGCCATFVSSLCHALVWADDSVMKIVLFMKYKNRTFEKGNKHNQIFSNIFVEEERKLSVDSEDDVHLSILISNKKESNNTVKIKKRNQLSSSKITSRRENLMSIKME